MNFFSEFAYEKSKAKMSMLRTVVIAIVFLGVLGSVYLFFNSEYYKLDEESVELNVLLSDARYVVGKQRLNEETKKLEALNKYLSALEGLDTSIDMLHDFTAEENYTIMKAFPMGTYIISYGSKEWDLTINGYAVEVDLVPAIVENLTQTGLFRTVYAPATTWQEISEGDPLWVLTNQGIAVSDLRGLYSFEIYCRFSTREGE